MPDACASHDMLGIAALQYNSDINLSGSDSGVIRMLILIGKSVLMTMRIRTSWIFYHA